MKILIACDNKSVNFGEICCIINSMTRSYQLKSRGDSQNRTRQKIIEAAIHLHQTKGLGATSMNDIAEQAKVGKVTVYRHFPDMAAMVGACSGTYFERHPLPDPESWKSIGDASERFRLGLRQTYAYHRATEPMIAQVLAEARDHPVMAPYHAHWHKAANALAAAWGPADRCKLNLPAAIALALSFDTWRTLARDNALTDKQAIELMVRLTCKCPPRSR